MDRDVKRRAGHAGDAARGCNTIRTGSRVCRAVQVFTPTGRPACNGQLARGAGRIETDIAFLAAVAGAYLLALNALVGFLFRAWVQVRGGLAETRLRLGRAELNLGEDDAIIGAVRAGSDP